MDIKIQNVDVNYIDTKNGDETILLLHGWGTNMYLFKDIINSLKENYRVVALDLPGFSKTKIPKENMTVKDYTDFIIEFLKKLNIKKTHLLGHSFGGRIILKLFDEEYIKQKNFEIGKIILIDAAGIKPKKDPKIILKIKIFKSIKKVFENTLLSKMYPNFIEDMRKKMGSDDYNNADPIMRKILVNVVNEDLKENLRKIKNKTLLIWGENDDATPLKDGFTMKKEILYSKLVIVEGGSHYSFLDNPSLVNENILSFLKEA